MKMIKISKSYFLIMPVIALFFYSCCTNNIYSQYFRALGGAIIGLLISFILIKKK
ncbi:hypothetical protein KY334_02670 [Candidatus Woesearchaeota archaeon]|nr:hypothetical protein [Candidatus Woesearchaeota archaeon]